MIKTQVKPNLLIVGSAKCGTSSLHNYLAQHPEIFMSKKKEPRFFSSLNRPSLGGPKDHEVEAWYVKNYDEYLALFQDVQNEKVIGESSADTLYFHENTIPLIKKHLEDPKILIILRDPVKRAFSAFQHLKRDDREPLTFEEGIDHEHERVDKNWELIYHYIQVSLYHEPVKQFMTQFKNVKVVISEELQANPEKVLSEIFNFLEVDDSFIPKTDVEYNRSGIPKSRFIHNFFFKGNTLRKMISPIARSFLSHDQRVRITQKIQKKNLTRQSIDSKTKHQLRKRFIGDIKKLEKLIGLDLNTWWNFRQD